MNENVQINNNLGGSGIVTVNSNYNVGFVTTGNGNGLLIDDNITLEIGNSTNADDLTIGNGSVVTVDPGGNLIVWGDLVIDEDDNVVLNISGSLIVHGDLIIDDDASFTLNGSGTVTIEGDLLAGSDVTMDVNGNMTIEGDFVTEEELNLDIDGFLSVEGTFEFDVDDDNEDEGADIVVGGTFDIGGDFDSEELDNLNFTVEDGGEVTIGGDFLADDDLDLVVGDGEMTIGDDFVADDDAELIVNDGTITITDNIATDGGSTLDVNGSGTVTAASCSGEEDVCDNLSVQLEVLYSRVNGDWDQGSTWSTTGFGGGSCSCTPNENRRVIIGNNRTVLLDSDGEVGGVEIQSTGRLEWDGNNNSLEMAGDAIIEVQAGGVLTGIGETGSSIIFDDNDYTVIVNGSLDIRTLDFNNGASVDISGSGTLTANTALVDVQAGGIVVNNIAVAGASFTLNDDLEYGASNSAFVNNGILTMDNLVVDGGNGNSMTNTGTLSFSDIDLDDNNFTLNNSGTIHQTGDFENVDAGSAFNNLSNGTWNFSGTGIDGVRLFASNNSNTFNYNRNGAQTIIDPQDAYSNITLSNTGTKTADDNFSVRGNWTRTGTAVFDPDDHTVSLTGNIPQTVSAVGGETFYSLTIDNSSGVTPQITFNNPVTVQRVLTMDDGIIDLNGNAVTHGTGTGSAAQAGTLTYSGGWMYGGSLTRFVRTNAITVGDLTGLFPMGTQTDFRPFYIGKSNTGSSNGTLTVSHTDPGGATDVSFTDNTIPVSAGTVTIQRVHNSHWSVSKTGITAGTFSIRAGGTGYVIAALSHLRLTHANDAAGMGTAVASTGSVSDARANRTGLSFGQLVGTFHMASLDASNTPLPVTLAYYRAELRDGEVISTWKTLQEKNNHFFTVQKTTDFETFHEVGVVEGQGNSSGAKTYSFVDDAPFHGRSYYRLKQTDYDGRFSFSEPVMIDYQASSSLILNMYPNPSKGDQVTIELSGASGIGQIPVYIYDLQGHKVMDVVIDESAPGVYKREVAFPAQLTPGLYVFKAGRTLRLTRKFVVY